MRTERRPPTDKGILRRLIVVAVFWTCVYPSSFGSAAQIGGGIGPELVLEKWDEASALFRTDPHWLGGDGASSVDLGSDRILWLFGDSLIDTSPSSSRAKACLVRNSVAIQKGRRPEAASMRFFWKVLGNRPRSFFAEEGDCWFWPGSGARVADTLIVFLVRVRRADNPLGFVPDGWKAVRVPNVDDEPSLWAQITSARHPGAPIALGSACTIVMDGYVYAIGSDREGLRAYAARWPVARAASGDLTNPEWWMGPQRAWVQAKRPTEKPVPLFAGAASEFSITFIPDLRGYVAFQTMSLADPCVAVRFSPALEQGWSDPACVYHTLEAKDGALLVYAAKAHTVFEGVLCAVTYVVNTLDITRLLEDTGIYYPVVLKCRLGEGTPVHERTQR